MTRPMVRIHDLATDKVIDREMNDKEFTEYEVMIEAQTKANVEAKAKAIQRQAILDRLGLTAEEAALLLP